MYGKSEKEKLWDIVLNIVVLWIIKVKLSLKWIAWVVFVSVNYDKMQLILKEISIVFLFKLWMNLVLW
jgi:hypothetical protein